MIARKWEICKNLYRMPIKKAPSQSKNRSIVILLTLEVPPALVNRFLTPSHLDTCPGFGKVSQSYGLWQSYTPTIYYRIWELHKDHLILQNLTCFLEILCFQAFEPIFSSWVSFNKILIVWTTCPYAGLFVIPCGSKVMADCWVTHHTSPCFLRWAYTVSCNFLMKKMFATLLPWEQHVPMFGIFATNNGCMCN